MFFLRKGRRAQRAENFDAISYTLKKYIRLLRSELETKSYTLKTVYDNYGLGSTHLFSDVRTHVQNILKQDVRSSYAGTNHLVWQLLETF